ncbi:MAG: phosphatase PAP2 family protein [Acidimicrobiales bacterium]
MVLLLMATATRGRRGRLAVVAPFAGEAALVCSLYGLWRLARMLPLTHAEGAYRRGEQLWDMERALHLPSELTITNWVLTHDWLAKACNVFYATAHVPALLAFLVWLFVRHRDRYGSWRNALAILTGACLLVRFVRVAPPRLLPHLGFVDVAARYDQSVYGTLGTGVSDQFAAMPSIHVGWSVLIGIAVLRASTSRWRGLVLLHPLATNLVVVATANHWWLDGVVAVALLGLAVALDRAARIVIAAITKPGGRPEPAPVLDAAPVRTGHIP